MGYRQTLLGVLLLVGAGTAQQRSPLFATVTGPDGKPLANAEVTCSSLPTPHAPWAKDAVVAKTDARGRARCNLVVGRVYVAWAVGAATSNGEHWVTAPHTLVAAGRVIDMRALDEHGPREVEVPGLAAWREVGGKGVRWYPDCGECVGIDLAMPDEGNRITIPATPWCQGAVAITDANGEAMVCSALLPGSTDLKALSAPEQMTVEVLAADGQPLADATVSYRLDTLMRSRALTNRMTMPLPPLRVVGKTGAAGTLRFYAPEQRVVEHQFGEYQQHLLVCVTSAGFQKGVGVLGEATSVQVRIDEGEPVQVLVRGEGAAAASVASVGPFSISAGRSSHMFGQRRLVTTRKSENRWLVHGVGSGLKTRVQIAAKRPTTALTPYVNAPTSPVLIDLDAMPRVVVAVTTAEGGPAPATLIVGHPRAGHPPSVEATIATDLSGHACLHLGSEAYFVYAIAGQSHALAMIDKDTVGPVQLKLEPVETMTLRVLDEDGQPVVGARVKGHSTSVSGTNDGKDLDSQWIRQSSTMIWHFLQLVRSDRKGIVEVPVFLRGSMRAEGVVWLGDRSSEPFQLQVGTSRDVVLK